MNKKCKICNCVLSKYNHKKICNPCQRKKIREEMEMQPEKYLEKISKEMKK